MKRLFVRKLLTVTLLLGIASPALATDAFNRRGPYVGLGMAGGFSDFGGAARDSGDSPGFNVRGGYRFNDYVAIEALYEYMNDFGKGRRDFVSTRATGNFSTNNFNVMGKLLVPIPGVSNLQPYVSGGLGFLNVDGADRLHATDGTLRRVGSGTELAGRVDGGVDYYFTHRIATFLDAGYVMPTEQLDHLKYISLSLGVKYRF